MTTVLSTELLDLVEQSAIDILHEDENMTGGPGTRPVQISATAYERVSKVAEATGISRAQIIDHMVMRMTAREIVATLKADKVTRRPVGRRKQRYHE